MTKERKSLFLVGWRPTIGWVCCTALALNFIALPIATFACLVLRIDIDFTQIPGTRIDAMMPVVLGMLGLGAMRSFEKTRGVQSNSMKD